MGGIRSVLRYEIEYDDIDQTVCISVVNTDRTIVTETSECERDRIIASGKRSDRTGGTLRHKTVIGFHRIELST